MTQVKLHDTVALIEEIKNHRFMTDQKIILRRGQVGTVVEKYKDGEAFEVEYPETAIKGIVKGVKLAFLEHNKTISPSSRVRFVS